MVGVEVSLIDEIETLRIISHTKTLVVRSFGNCK
jgi:hypothetical protein